MKHLVTVKRLASSTNFLPLLVVFFFVWLATKPLFGVGYFNMHDDLQIMRQLQMEKCFIDLQIPCRWVPDMGYGYGYPLFNYYPPLPYLTGEVFRLIGFSFVDTAKALFITAFFASGITMYFFAKRFFGRLGGVLSAIFYVWAPYHAVDTYVRGAMNESWGLIWFPAILLFSYSLIAAPNEVPHGGTKWGRSRDILLLSLSWVALLVSHNLMVIIFTPFFALWCGMWLLYHKNWKAVFTLLASGVMAFCLAAFFTLPVFLEKSIVQTDSLIKGYYEFTAHFPSIHQLLFSRFWGYGPSVWMLADEMSFQIGWLHWIVPLFLIPLLVVVFLRKRKFTPLILSVGCLFLVGWLATFMDHPKSTPIWEHIKAIQFVQFPWRYLTMVILGFSFCVGALMAVFPKVIRHVVFVLLVVGVVLYSSSYFLPQNGKLGPLADAEKLSGVAFDMQQTAGIYDYLPNTAKTAPKAPRRVIAEVIEGEGEVHPISEGTDWFKFEAHNTGEKEAVLRINQLYFPNWEVMVDGKKVDTYIPESEQWGRFYISVPAGEHKVYGGLHDTPVRVVGNIVSLVSWVGLVGFVVFRYRKMKKAVL